MAQHLSNLPIGALIKFGKHIVNTEAAQPIIWKVVDKNHSGYPSNSVTLITDKIIDLRCYDYSEDRTDYPNGNPHYKKSNINQWLSSSATAGNWFESAYQYDTSPGTSGAGYGGLPGFQYNFSTAERTAILPTTLTVQNDTDVSESMVASVFLPSVWEILGTYTVADGSSQFAYFASEIRTTTVTAQVFNNTKSSIYKPSSLSDNYLYGTRSSTGKYICYITASGTKSTQTPVGIIGIRPCINLSANAKISDTTDADGCYTVSFNTIPTISGTDGNLGTKSDGFSQSYTVNDTDKDSITVTEYIDGAKIRSYVATIGASNTFDVTNKTWLGLTNGVHTLKIVATDGFDEVTRIYTFTKNVTKLVIQRTTPLDSATKPKSIIVSIVKNIPTEAIFKVEACNNGYDTTPAWEDITSKVTRGEIHDFINTSKTAGKWGVNIRVTVDRNGSEGACYITEIGGNFE